MPESFIEQLILSKIEELETKEEEHRYNINEVQDTTSLVTLTPWLRRTKWPERFKGKDMKTLHDLTKRPKAEEAAEVHIWNAVDRVLRKCWSGLEDCLERGWELIPFWLISAVQDKKDMRPFSRYIVPYTLRRYINYWQSYILFCIRMKDSLEYTIQQRRLIQRVYELMESSPLNDEELLDDLLLELSISLICHSDYAHAYSSLIYFTGVMGYNVDYKQWRQPHDYTTILAGLQFCIRVIMLEAALPSNERDNFNELSEVTPVEQFCKVREKWLVDSEGK